MTVANVSSNTSQCIIKCTDTGYEVEKFEKFQIFGSDLVRVERVSSTESIDVNRVDRGGYWSIEVLVNSTE